jgi:hypothetical protein
MRPRNNAEPGTGTQYATIASEGETFRANGETWKVGHDYLDTEIGDVCELVHVTGKSSWCDTGDPEQNPYLVFKYERHRGEITFDPNDPSGELGDRFIERVEPQRPREAPRR